MFLTDAGLIYKGIRPLQKLVIGNPFAGLSLPQKTPDHLRVVPPDPWSGDAQKGRDIVAAIFRFAGQTIEKEDLSWEPAHACPEWVSELHSFEWLRDLRSAGGDRARRMAREMAASWMEMYPKPHDIAWRPDITGLRIAAWISFHDFFCASAGDKFREEYFTSLTRQARHLARALPGNLSGIPMMQALKGLAYSGLCFDDGEGRLQQAFKGIKAQIAEQILPDGSHVSRNPQNTYDFLHILVDLRTSLTSAREEVPPELQHAIDRIAPAVKFFRHGDGCFALFNGAQEGSAGICDSTLMHSGARGKAMSSLPHCGYDKITQGRSSLIMDIGLPPAPKYAERVHAGLLSFEYSFGKDRVFVNCGTSQVAGRWRTLLRSTAAHTAVTLDHRNSCPIESGPGLCVTRPEVRHKHAEDDDVAMIEASHNGYVPRYGITHRRCVRLLENGEKLVGEEQLLGKSGVDFAVRFHLHPNIQASLICGGNEVLLRARSGTGWRFVCDGAPVALEESVYGGTGETPRRSQQIVLSGITEGGPTNIPWELKREK